ncbi:hypothetical protein E2C01_059513 [Portunus trituberculatus]|uniref:Uncharacterized protein n=1 Tax=Portunus trituberculatus TaxID=210409 RepID=A0A5B7H6A1_PORTR|nr:hypothetical protein [Portunus trituberculatus]
MRASVTRDETFGPLGGAQLDSSRQALPVLLLLSHLRFLLLHLTSTLPYSWETSILPYSYVRVGHHTRHVDEHSLAEASGGSTAGLGLSHVIVRVGCLQYCIP